MSPRYRFVGRSSHRFDGYPSSDELVERYRVATRAAGGRESVAGASVEGRPLLRFDLGTPGRPVVLLTALMHGIEVIGSLALLDVMDQLASRSRAARSLLDESHMIVIPVVNPDALFANMARIAAGKRAWQRCNANGVDLNRNFPRLTASRMRHPFSGSRFRASPHYIGPHALSEPESRAIHAVAMAARPRLSLAFHSFGELLLYPWAHTDRPNERAAEYQELAATMVRVLGPSSYRPRQARHLYPVLGDMDDWLDATLGTLAMTVEVGRTGVRLRDGLHLLNPFCWMNPARIRDTIDSLTPGIMALLARGIDVDATSHAPSEATAPTKGLELAAK